MLKVLMLRKRIDNLRKDLDTLRAKDAEFETRQADLEKAISEVETEEQRSAVEEMVNAFETEKRDHDEAVGKLEKEIEELEGELREEESKQETEPEAQPEPKEERKEIKIMLTRNKAINRMSIQERSALVADEGVKAFLGEIRSAIREKRAISGVGLLIPTVILPIFRENVIEYSKLYKHVNVQPVAGEARQPIMGTVAEAIWTECCANLNELALGFNDWEVDCYKVGGFYAICNANIEDSDIDLLAEVMIALGQAIGLALDKAILYGRNTAKTMKMPLGVVTRLVQQSAPSDYPATAREWQDLHVSNVKTIASSVTGANLIKAIVVNAGAMKGKYSRGEKVWVMNEKTYTYLMSETISVDGNGRIVSGVSDRMPVIGGAIEVLDFVPDNVIIGGYFDLYLLAERAGAKFAQSEHVRFLADQTVMKGTARYDGAPVIAEGFIALDIYGGTVAATDVTFAPDAANEVQNISLPTAATVAAGEKIQLFAITAPGSGEVTWASATTGKATVDQNGVVTGVASGSSVISATANGITANCTVTVTA